MKLYDLTLMFMKRDRWLAWMGGKTGRPETAWQKIAQLDNMTTDVATREHFRKHLEWEEMQNYDNF